MSERILKFVLMVMAVILIGTGATMLNLNLRKTSRNEDISLAADFVQDGEEGNQEKRTAADNGLSGGMASAETAAAASGVRTAGDQAEPEKIPAETAPTVAETVKSEEDQEDGQTENKTAVSVGGNINIQVEPENAAYAVVASEKTEEDSAVTEYQEIVIIQVEDTPEAYYSRLSEMDRKLQAKAEEAAKKSVADQKEAADEALKFWDDELNDVYRDLRETLSEEAFAALREEERAWIRSRDEAANMAAAAENYSNSVQSLAYTLSLAESTKARVYVLAEMYYGE